MWQVCRAGWQCCSAHRQGSCAKGHTGAPPAHSRMEGNLEGLATGVLSPRGSPIVPYPGPVYPCFTTLWLEDLYKAPAENTKTKLSKRVFNALKRVFYRYYQKCECCELGLQRNTYPSSSCFYPFSQFVEKALFYPMNQFIILCSQPCCLTAAFPAQSEEQSCLTRKPRELPWVRGALQKGARTKVRGCRLTMVSQESFLTNSLWGFCKTM